MRVLVAYMSQSGNTKKVAEAIFQEIEAEKELKELGEIEALEGYDLYFVGFPIQGYGPASPAKVLLEQHAAGKDVALFVTHAAPEDGDLLPQWLAACRDAAVGASIVGMFNCQGELAQAVADFMKSSGDAQLAAWADERPDTIGQPDAARLERAKVFAREVIGKYSA